MVCMNCQKWQSRQKCAEWGLGADCCSMQLRWRSGSEQDPYSSAATANCKTPCICTNPSAFATCLPTAFPTCPMCGQTFLWTCHSETAQVVGGDAHSDNPGRVRPSTAVLDRKSRTIEMTYAKTSVCAGRFCLWDRYFGIHHHGAAAGSRSRLPSQYS